MAQLELINLTPKVLRYFMNAGLIFGKAPIGLGKLPSALIYHSPEGRDAA